MNDGIPCLSQTFHGHCHVVSSNLRLPRYFVFVIVRKRVAQRKGFMTFLSRLSGSMQLQRPAFCDAELEVGRHTGVGFSRPTPLRWSPMTTTAEQSARRCGGGSGVHWASTNRFSISRVLGSLGKLQQLPRQHPKSNQKQLLLQKVLVHC